MKCKLLKITNRLGNPTFHFELKEKVYFYEFRGIKADYRIEFYCTKTHFDYKCKNVARMFPSEFLLNYMKDFAKMVVKSDPMVYDINNYDLNTFENDYCHNHPGTELDDYFKNIFSDLSSSQEIIL